MLASVMPGGEGFEEAGENEYAGRLNIKVGLVQGKFQGNIKLSDIVIPESYNMAVDGKGTPGFVKANGRLQLTSQGSSTHMVYEGTAQVGGRIASVGQRLIDTSANSIIRQSLEGLNEYLKVQAPKTAVPADEVREEETAPDLVPEYQPPTQTAVAMNVAKDVASDLIPPQYRPVILGVAGVLVIVILYLLLS